MKMLILIFCLLYLISWDIYIFQYYKMNNSQIRSKYFNFKVIMSGNYQVRFLYAPKWRCSVLHGNLRAIFVMMFFVLTFSKNLFVKHYDLNFPGNKNTIKKDSVFYTKPHVQWQIFIWNSKENFSWILQQKSFFENHFLIIDLIKTHIP